MEKDIEGLVILGGTYKRIINTYYIRIHKKYEGRGLYGNNMSGAAARTLKARKKIIRI